MSNTRTEISSLGEFGLIEHLTQQFEITQATTLVGIGDDAAVIEPFKKQIVISTDMLVEGVHFDLMYTPLKHLGYKSVVVNLSDIYAMNAEPTHITVSIAISNKYSVEALEELYEGIQLACEKYGVDLIGGDTTTSLKGLVISITAIGEVETDKFIKRSTAQEHDLICVSGNLGAAFIGLTIMEREKKIYLENPTIQPSLEGADYVVQRILKPEARKDIIELLKESNIHPTSMIDISDGLSSELIHLCTQSQVSCSVYEEKIPIHEQTKTWAINFNLSPTTCALNGGEDYELLFTIPQADYEKIASIEDVHIIGHITKADVENVLITPSGASHKIVAQGWKHLN
jgi:thiamine-monophosphate kinase